MFSALRVLLGDAGTSGVAASYSYALFTWGAGSSGAGGRGNTSTVSVPMQVGVQTDWSSVDMGNVNGAAIKLNGTLWTWGDNTDGELGQGDTTDRSCPVQVGSDSDWAEVSISSHTLAVKTDGTLWSWGMGLNGKLGHGNTTSLSSPVKVGSLTDWSKVSVNLQSSAMLKTDGTIWSMGRNDEGALGVGDTTARSSPTQVGIATDWASVVVLNREIAAINTSGELWISGLNSSGQLGLGDTTDRSNLTQVGSLTTWNKIAGGYSLFHATQTDGTLWAWGKGNSGGSGQGDTVNRSSPTQIGSLTDWDFPGANYGRTGVAIKTDGSAWAWGDDTISGQLGTNTTTDISSPVQIGGATDWQDIDNFSDNSAGIRKINNNAGYALWTWGIGGSGRSGHGNTTNYSSPVQVGTLNEWTKYIAMVYQGMLGVKVDGTLWGWGKGNVGQLGLGNTSTYSSPMQVGNDGNWAKVKGGSQFTIATKTDGTLWGWGDGANGRTGHGNSTDYNSPVQVGELTDWSNFSVANGGTVVAIKTDGTLWGWGSNSNGQIGDGSATGRNSPVQVGSLTTWSKAVTEGESTLAINTGGELFGWGINNRGQAGLGDTTARSSPVKVGSLTNWADIAAASSSTYGMSFAINTAGELFSWGDGMYGGTGHGDVVDRSSPVQVGSLTNWSSLPLDTETAIEMTAIKTDGTLWGWGSNNSGRIGIGNTTKYSSPVQVGAGGGWAASSIGTSLQASLRRPTIAAGTTSGYLFACGDNSPKGALGIGDVTDRSNMVQIGTDATWTDVCSGGQASGGVKSDGTAWAWGNGDDGQLCQGNTTSQSSPVQVGAQTDWDNIWVANLFLGVKTTGKL